MSPLPSDTIESANLLIAAIRDAEHPTHIFYRPRTGGSLGTHDTACDRSLDFGGHGNPLFDALPQEIVFDLAAEPQLAALSELFIAERSFSRCGSGFIGKRLSEILVIYAIRRAIAEGTVTAGLLAGLAHPIGRGRKASSFFAHPYGSFRATFHFVPIFAKPVLSYVA